MFQSLRTLASVTDATYDEEDVRSNAFIDLEDDAFDGNRLFLAAGESARLAFTFQSFERYDLRGSGSSGSPRVACRRPGLCLRLAFPPPPLPPSDEPPPTEMPISPAGVGAPVRTGVASVWASRRSVLTFRLRRAYIGA